MPPRYLLFWSLLLLSCGYALARGQKHERTAAAIFLAATSISVVTHITMQVRYLDIDMGEVVVDTAVLISLVGIALVSDRFWPLWAAGLQLVGSLAHVLKALPADLPPWAYAIAERFWSYPILIILFIGAWRGQRRLSRAQSMGGVAAER